jgi:hypothetical protein
VYYAGYLRNLHTSSSSEGHLVKVVYGLISHNIINTTSLLDSVSGGASSRYLSTEDSIGTLKSVSRSFTGYSTSNTDAYLEKLGWGLAPKTSVNVSQGSLQGARLALPLTAYADSYSASPIVSMLVPVSSSYAENRATLVKLTHKSSSLAGSSYSTSSIKLDRTLLLIPTLGTSASYQVNGGLTLSTPYYSHTTAEGILHSTTGILPAPKLSEARLDYTGITSFYTINEEGNTIAAPGVLLLNYVAEIAYNRIYYSQATAPRIFYSGGI